VRGTFSQSRLTLPASAVGSARTLGSTMTRRCGVSRKCACRREPNSHKRDQAASSSHAAGLRRGLQGIAAPYQSKFGYTEFTLAAVALLSNAKSRAPREAVS
jgi:hypothetical protein